VPSRSRLVRLARKAIGPSVLSPEDRHRPASAPSRALAENGPSCTPTNSTIQEGSRDHNSERHQSPRPPRPSPARGPTPSLPRQGPARGGDPPRWLSFQAAAHPGDLTRRRSDGCRAFPAPIHPACPAGGGRARIAVAVANLLRTAGDPPRWRSCVDHQGQRRVSCRSTALVVRVMSPVASRSSSAPRSTASASVRSASAAGVSRSGGLGVGEHVRRRPDWVWPQSGSFQRRGRRGRTSRAQVRSPRRRRRRTRRGRGDLLRRRAAPGAQLRRRIGRYRQPRRRRGRARV
jgi:hypothetical protein